MPVLAWLVGKLAASPLISRLLIPAIAKALGDFFARQADRIDLRAAVKTVRAAKTAEEMRNASKKLSDATNRRG
jgi:hypothetical protein